jgi:hypothetical protein
MSPKDRPRVVIVGSPAMFRGSTRPGRDVEMQILKYFPGVALFIEKPIVTGPVHEVDEAYKIAKTIGDTKTICSVRFAISLSPLITGCGPSIDTCIDT